MRGEQSQAKREGSMQANPSTSKREGSTKSMASATASSNGRPKVPSSIAAGRFSIEKRLGAGCFGEVYRGKSSDGTEVAVKFEDLQARTQQLEQEATIMSILRQPVQQQGFSECFHYGREGRFYCMVMELLGKSLEDCVQKQGGKFSVKSTAMVAEQLIRRVEYLHSKGIIHRDIKPENFMWGINGKIHHLYMIDFGLSKRYYDKIHIQFRSKLSLTGTARYASINAHKGFEQSRRDDLEAIGHMLLYFLRGSLPWSGLEAKTKEEKYRKIREKKESTKLAELCAGFPEQFQTYCHTCRQLEFTDRPDYKGMRKMFTDIRDAGLQPGQSVDDHDLDWLAAKELVAKDLVPLNPWIPPRQPDDSDADGGSSFKCGFPCLCGGKAPRD